MRLSSAGREVVPAQAAGRAALTSMHRASDSDGLSLGQCQAVRASLLAVPTCLPVTALLTVNILLQEDYLVPHVGCTLPDTELRSRRRDGRCASARSCLNPREGAGIVPASQLLPGWWTAITPRNGVRKTTFELLAATGGTRTKFSVDESSFEPVPGTMQAPGHQTSDTAPMLPGC